VIVGRVPSVTLRGKVSKARGIRWTAPSSRA
jgi:hypothetical protein